MFYDTECSQGSCLGSIDDETRHNMAIASYGELIVIRWAQAARNAQGGVVLIDGMSGSNFSQDNLKELGLLSGFMQYYQVTRKLKALNPDSQDLALLSALAVLTCDRGVPISPSQSAVIYRLQEWGLIFTLNFESVQLSCVKTLSVGVQQNKPK